MSNKLIEVKGLKKYWPIGKTGLLGKPSYYLRAVDDVAFEVRAGETFGLVGELGAGKTSLVYTMIGLHEPDGGEVLFEGRNIFDLNKKELKEVRKNIGVVFANPYTSLNPRMTFGRTLKEVLLTNRILENSSEAEKRISEVLPLLGFEPHHIPRYPHEFSGGQRQRIAIARALISYPKLLILDEPTIMLDMSVKASILNLMRRLKNELNLTMVFVSNSLGVIRFISDTIGVMQMGRFVEVATKDVLFSSPKHPYTLNLMATLPLPDPDYKLNPILKMGAISARPPEGCPIQAGCPYETSKCYKERPDLVEIEKDHYVACHNIN